MGVASRVALLVTSVLAAPVSAQSIGVTSFDGESSAPTARLFGANQLEVGLDTAHERDEPAVLAENQYELLVGSRMGLDATLSPLLRAVVEARARWRVTARSGLTDGKGSFEVEAGEAFIDLYTPVVDVRVGQQVVPLGASALMSPLDVLNPRDLRHGLFALAAEDDRLPAFAVRLKGSVGPVSWLAAYFPFFRAHRFTLIGQDEALVQPTLGVVGLDRIDPSIEDLLEPQAFQTQRPQAFGQLGDLGLSVDVDLAGTRVGVAAALVNERVPRFEVDPALGDALGRLARGETVPTGQLLTLVERLNRGEALFTGTYGRQLIAGVYGRGLIGPFQLDVDVAASPRQTLLGSDFLPFDRPVGSWVVSLSTADAASPLRVGLLYGGLAADVDEGPGLFLLEPADRSEFPRVAALHTLAASVSQRFERDNLELGVRGILELTQGSFALAPQVAYFPADALMLFVSLHLFEGPPKSPLGYYGRNDQVVVGLVLEL